jgi:hypothetical protein
LLIVSLGFIPRFDGTMLRVCEQVTVGRASASLRSGMSAPFLGDPP